MARIGTVPLDLFPGAETFASNFNGGFYAMPAAMARTLGPLWREYATFNLGQADLLGKYLQHSDQLGIGMAVAQSGVPVDLLPFVTNLPTHLPKASLAALAPQAIGALHYHQHLDQLAPVLRATAARKWLHLLWTKVSARIRRARPARAIAFGLSNG